MEKIESLLILGSIKKATVGMQVNTVPAHVGQTQSVVGPSVIESYRSGFDPT